MPYEFRGDIAHADIAFNVWGETLEELFTDAARATLEVMVENLAGIQSTETIEVSLDQESEEMLLFDFLSEFIFYKDAKRLLLLPTEVSIQGAANGFSVHAKLQGEQIDVRRHRMNTDVKAVTMLRYALERVPEGWRATVVLDV